MRKSETAQKYNNGNTSFPILHEGDGIRIYKNPSGEIFIEDVASGVTMRLSRAHAPSGGLQFTTDNCVDPVRVTNMIGWRISRR